jgi:hypothetical protein
MALRRKERPLTLEETKEKLLESTAEAWLHSEPLCGYAPHLDNGKILALNPKIENSIVVILLLDPADFTTERVFDMLGGWFTRYRKLQWTPILVFRAKYQFLKNPRFFEIFRHFSFFTTLPIFIDEQNSWFNFLNATGPTLAYLQNGEISYQIPLQPDFENQITAAELELQKCLRKNNPGLPLLEVIPTKVDKPVDQKTISAKEMIRTGYWTEIGSSIASDDPNAKISIPFSGTHLRVIATTNAQSRENTRAQIFLDEIPLPASLRGSQVHAADHGHTVLEINKYTGIYEIIKSHEAITGTISLKFLNTLENPVILYELRFA